MDLCLLDLCLLGLCLLLERKIYFKRAKNHKSCKNTNLHLVLVMRDCFFSFVLTFRNLCKSTLAYSPELIIFCFLLAPYFPNLFIKVSFELHFSGIWSFYSYHFILQFSSGFPEISGKFHISFSRDFTMAVSIFSSAD